MMPKIRRILFATDFSPASSAAYRKLVALNAALKAQLLVIHVVSPVYQVEAVDAAAVARAAQRDAEARLAKLRPSPARTVVRYGVAHEAIAQEARRSRADLVVVGSHGRTGLQRILLGSVAEAVVRHAPCPVLTIPGRRR
jgi:universal stress protein A